VTAPSSRSPYRNELDALRERKETLEREIARLGEQTSQLDVLRSQQQELERELRAIAQTLGAGGRRPLPLLDNIAVASPCSANWDEMLSARGSEGDDRVRFCLSCEKNVYNLSAMESADAERLLAERSGAEICVRYYKRADGTIMTQDCPVGVEKKRRKKVVLAVAGAGAMAFAAAATLMRETTCHTMGEMAVQVPTVEPAVEPPAPQNEWRMGDRAEPTPAVMGTAAPLQTATPPQPVKPSTPPAHLMGRRAR
jgi:hypothetical protein